MFLPCPCFVPVPVHVLVYGLKYVYEEQEGEARLNYTWTPRDIIFIQSVSCSCSWFVPVRVLVYCLEILICYVQEEQEGEARLNYLNSKRYRRYPASLLFKLKLLFIFILLLLVHWFYSRSSFCNMIVVRVLFWEFNVLEILLLLPIKICISRIQKISRNV